MAVAYVGTPGVVRSNSISTSNKVITSASFTPAVGELLVVKASGQSADPAPASVANSGTALSWRLVGSLTGASRCNSAIWVAAVTVSQAMTVTVTFNTSAASSSAKVAFVIVERYSGAYVPAVPNVASAAVDTTSPFSVPITPLVQGSLLTWLDGDYNQAGGTSGSGTAPTYLNSAVETGRGVYTSAGFMGFYAAYQRTPQPAPSPGVTVDCGMTAPTGQSANLIALELIPAEVPGGMLAAA